jgi:hypothetical protein
MNKLISFKLIKTSIPDFPQRGRSYDILSLQGENERG